MTLKYDKPSGYTQAIPSGVAALRKYLVEEFGFLRTEVIRDRSRCAKKSSEHCACRAIDAFTTNVEKGNRLFEWCIKNASRLGIQSVIWRDRQWGFGLWHIRRRALRDHYDHVHVGINLWGSKNITRALLEGSAPSPQPTPTPAPTPDPEWKEKVMAKPVLRKGARGAEVKRLQCLLLAAGATPGDWLGPKVNGERKPDGIFGDGLAHVLTQLRGDPNCGPDDWAALVGV